MQRMVPASRRLVPALIAIGLAGLAAVGVAAFQVRAEDGTQAMAPSPLSVVALAVVREQGYRVEDRFTGRLEPARQTRLAFERPGLVTDIRVEEGDQVQAGQIIARLDDSSLRAQLDRLEAQRRAAAANLDLAKLTLQRQRTLAGKGHAAEQRLDEARLSAEALAAQLAEMEAAVRATRIDLEKSVLTAPFAGTVSARMLDEGAVVGAGTGVADLLETARPMARIGVAPTLAADLRQDMAVSLFVRGEKVPATLTALRPDLTTSTRTLTALFTLDGPVPAGFGETVELRLERTIAAPGLWVPLAALIEGQRGLWSVFTVVDGPGGEAVVARESVEVLHVAGGRAYVQGPLTEGTRLVAGGPHRVVPGQPVLVAARAE